MVQNKIIKISLVFMVIFLGLLIIGVFPKHAKQGYEFSYIEDASAEMNIQEAEKALNFHAEKGHENGMFAFGNSSSAYWIKIPLPDTKTDKAYISVYSPTVGSLYIDGIPTLTTAIQAGQN